MKNHKQGFIVPLLITIIIVLVIVGAVYYYETNKNQIPGTTNPTATSTSACYPNCPGVNMSQGTASQASSQIPGWKTYTDAKYEFSFQSPSDWTFADNSYTKDNINYPLVLVYGPSRTDLPKNSLNSSSDQALPAHYIIMISVDDPSTSKIKSVTGFGTVSHVPNQQSTWNIYVTPQQEQATPEYSIGKQIINSFKYNSPSAPVNTVSTVFVTGMQKYTDSTFGFSFWYPSTWSVTDVTGRNLAPFGVGYNGPVGDKILRISNGITAIDIHEYNSVDSSIKDYPSPAAGNDPIEYYFDSTSHTWMQRDVGAGMRASVADVSVNTMGGLHMLTGAMRFQYDTIIPLSANHFLVVDYLGNVPEYSGSVNQVPLTQTIVATDPTVAIPVGTSQQTQTVQAEATAYNINGTYLTPTQIFQEVASQFGLVRSTIEYFRIWGQDKVQYNYGLGTNFAYKLGGTWHIVGNGNSQSGQLCSELINVPAQYNPGCYDTATAKNKYLNVNPDGTSSSLNYPPDQMYSYIGQ